MHKAMDSVSPSNRMIPDLIIYILSSDCLWVLLTGKSDCMKTRTQEGIHGYTVSFDLMFNLLI